MAAMPISDATKLKLAIQRSWSAPQPSQKASRYVGAFFDRVRIGKRIVAKVVGNHGTYTVSIEAQGQAVLSACSCYIGKGGGCHHCAALGVTFLQDPDSFRVVKLKKREDVQTVGDLHPYLQGVTLETLLKQLSEKGVTQKAFAEGIGMNPRQLSAIKSSEARHHYFNELGATKLACLWVLEHLTTAKGK
jgi:hypothetical protein